MHIVPGIDDGSDSMKMSLEMLSIAQEEGIRGVFCTSHSWYNPKGHEAYITSFYELQKRAKDHFPDMKLYSGCELFCYPGNIEKNIARLKEGTLLPLGDTRYVLTEFCTDVTHEEAELIVNKLLENHWKPIFAHVERYPKLFYGDTIEAFLEMGCMIQVNAYSLSEEKSRDIKERARELLRKKQIHFLGSDAHRTDHRPPRVKVGVNYILQNADAAYAEDLLYRNAERYLITK